MNINNKISLLTGILIALQINANSVSAAEDCQKNDDKYIAQQSESTKKDIINEDIINKGDKLAQDLYQVCEDTKREIGIFQGNPDEKNYNNAQKYLKQFVLLSERFISKQKGE